MRQCRRHNLMKTLGIMTEQANTLTGPLQKFAVNVLPAYPKLMELPAMVTAGDSSRRLLPALAPAPSLHRNGYGGIVLGGPRCGIDVYCVRARRGSAIFGTAGATAAASHLKSD